MRGYKVAIEFGVAGLVLRTTATLRSLKDVAELRDLSHRYSFLIKDEEFKVHVREPFAAPQEVVDAILYQRSYRAEQAA